MATRRSGEGGRPARSAAVRRGGRRLGLLALGVSGGAVLFVYRSTPDVPPLLLPSTTVSAAAEDRGDLCLDIADWRACYERPAAGAPGADGGSWVSRPLPSGAAPASGWRCGGQRRERTCVSRALHGAPFTREPGKRTQRPLRTPDNGEWECVETEGVVTCRSLADAAGVRTGLLDPAFVCGPRRGSAERICVDFSPDAPPALDRWECRVGYAAGMAERVCSPSATPRVGSACAASGECPRDAACVDRRCLPPQPAPACWYDQDCGLKGRCRWGSCLAKG